MTTRTTAVAPPMPAVISSVSDEAAEFARTLPPEALARMYAAVDEWARAAPVLWGRAILADEPEDPDWLEMVLEIAIDANDDQAWELWRELGDRMNAVDRALSEADLQRMSSGFGVHLLWGAWLETD